jgi:ADP-ribose pyrophosphatase YjhB (NUDIX family)
MSVPPPRHASRVVILDELDRVLLVEFCDPTDERRWWCLPGGGVDPDETWEDAARRELHEETGVADVDLGPLIWTREHRGTFMGRPFHAVERVFVVRVPHFAPTIDGWTELERRVHLGMRWWTVEELEADPSTKAPARIAMLLRSLLTDGPPTEPIDAGV